MDIIRCLKTNNPVGTDTWNEGYPCTCDNCQAWLKYLAEETITENK